MLDVPKFHLWGKTFLKRVLFAVLFLAATLTLSAQVNGRLTGSVVDQSGAAIPAASISVFLSGGSEPVYSATATTEGLFTLTGVRQGTYDIAVEAAGFRKRTVRVVKVDPGRETPLGAIALEIGSIAETVEVTARAATVQATNSEVSNTVTTEQIRRLPMLGRSPLALIATQAGVNSNARTNTTVNGQRTSYSNVTLDGINIQDNYIRTNALDFMPNMLLLDQVGEFTVSTSNANAGAGGGSAQVIFVTPSGANNYHGSLYWYNRNNVAAANAWFNNRYNVDKPFYNQNQVGGSIGGPIVKDKLLFYMNYEAYRRRQQTLTTRTILTADARQGIFTYRDKSGAVRKVNVLQAYGAQMDPTVKGILDQVPGPDKINSYSVGDSTESFLANTAGYSFNARNNRDRNNVTGKVDYYPSTKHAISGTFAWNSDLVDRNGSGISNDYSVVPKVTNDNKTKFLSATWRWNPAPSITNELRGGFNLAPGLFLTSEKFPGAILDGFSFSNPLNTFRGQGRYTDTYNYMDNAQYQRGRHNLQFGFQMQHIYVKSYLDNDITPTYTIGFGKGEAGLTQTQLPGIGSTDLANANLLLASLGGYVKSYLQTFNVKDRTSGFVSGANNTRQLVLNNYAGYLQDSWKVTPRVSINAGLRYELYSVLNELNGLYLVPVMNGGFFQTLFSNSTLDFAGSSVGRPYYNKDKNNFAPNLGIAWDPFGDGKTAIRAGYSLNYVNDDTFRAVENNISTAGGLAATSSAQITARASNLTPVAVPAYKVPRTFSDNWAMNTTSAVGMPDPTLRTPYVQQWTLSVQREVKGTLFELRYVGNHGTKEFRAFDFNQVVIKQNGFLDDFLRAQNNGFLSLRAGGSFNPAYNSSIAGSQRLTIFPKLAGGGLLTNSTVRSYLQTGQVGELANWYTINSLNGPVAFYNNPYALGINTIANYSNSTYNGLQFEATRRMSKGLQLQANYTYAKVLSDAMGDQQHRFEPFLDMNNPKIERARAPFDLTHVIKANGIYELPLGGDHRLSYRPLNKLLGGWSVSGIMTWESGAPFSVLSARGTLNRSGRSTQNTANTFLSGSQLDNLFQFHMTGAGPTFVDPSAVGPDGRAVAADGQPFFNGQAFYQPAAGSLGTMQRRMFSGPWSFNIDAAIVKNTAIDEKRSIEFRAQAVNALNHPTFYLLDQTVTSSQFGRITDTLNSARVIEFGLYFRF